MQKTACLLQMKTSNKTQTNHSEKKKTSSQLSDKTETLGALFFWLPAARVRIPGGSLFNNAKRTIPVREKQRKHSRSLAKTMKRINQIRKRINPPRKSASETREPFRSQVINGAQKERRIGAEKPLGSRYR